VEGFAVGGLDGRVTMMGTWMLRYDFFISYYLHHRRNFPSYTTIKAHSYFKIEVQISFCTFPFLWTQLSPSNAQS
jgi:hypothetical protein